jgi:hypothetical protein
MRQRSHRNWPIVGCHAAELGAGHEYGARTQVPRTESGDYTRGTSAYNENVYHLWLSQR